MRFGAGLALLLAASWSSAVSGPRQSGPGARGDLGPAAFTTLPWCPLDAGRTRRSCCMAPRQQVELREGEGAGGTSLGVGRAAVRVWRRRPGLGRRGSILSIRASNGQDGIGSDHRAFARQIDGMMERGKAMLGSSSPDKRELDEAVEDLEAGIRMLSARIRAEGNVEELRALLLRAEGLVDEMRRLSYNVPTPWQLSLPNFNQPRNRASGPKAPEVQPTGQKRGGEGGKGTRGLDGGGDERGQSKIVCGDGQGIDDVILRGEAAVKIARGLMGYLNPSAEVRQEMSEVLEELAAVASCIERNHKDDARAVAAKMSVETASEQLRSLVYKLPNAAPQMPSFSMPDLLPKPGRPKGPWTVSRSRSPSRAQGTSYVTKKRYASSGEAVAGGGGGGGGAWQKSKAGSGARRESVGAVGSGGRALLPRDMSNIRSLEELMVSIEPLLANTLEQRLSGSDAATAMNQVKRLGRQARDEATAARVDNAMMGLAKAVLDDAGSLQPRHVALALNAIADERRQTAERERGADFEVGSKIPWRWKNGREFTTSRRNTFAEGEPVVVLRSDGSSRFGCVDRVEGDEYLVRVSPGVRDAAFYRRETKGSLGKLMIGWATRKLQRREVCLSLGAILVSNRGLLKRSSARDLASSLWAHAKLNVANEALFLAVGNQIRKGDLLTRASPQDMANLLWAHATMGWQNKKLFLAVGSRLLEPDVLEGCNEQDISVILWAHARIKFWNADLCRGLASRVETLSVSNPQASSNLLWAFAELNMVEGYEAVVDKMCSQLEGDSGLARSATAQGVANMLWALSVIGQQQSGASKKLLVTALSKAPALDVADKCQLHQFFLSQRLCASSNDSEVLFDDDEGVEELRAECASSFVDVSSSYSRPSKIQQQVSELIKGMGIDHVEEYVLPGIGYSVDLWIPSESVAIEVEGPAHYLSDPGDAQSGLICGSTRLKRQHLRAWGIKLVSLAYYDLDEMALRSLGERQTWIRAQIDAALV